MNERPAVTRMEKAAEERVRDDHRRTFRIEVYVDVIDAPSLIAYADRRVQACWSDDLDNLVVGGESKVERALIEALLFSNENPSPDEYGIEFGGRLEIQEVTDA